MAAMQRRLRLAARTRAHTGIGVNIGISRPGFCRSLWHDNAARRHAAGRDHQKIESARAAAQLSQHIAMVRHARRWPTGQGSRDRIISGPSTLYVCWVGASPPASCRLHHIHAHGRD